jgi:hypothetical protein
MTTFRPLPDPGLPEDLELIKPNTIELTEYTVASLQQMLGICEEFFRTAGPGVIAELRGYLAAQNPPTDPLWLIDMIGFSGTHLRRLLPATAPSPRENWQDPTPDQSPDSTPDSGEEAKR